MLEHQRGCVPNYEQAFTAENQGVAETEKGLDPFRLGHPVLATHHQVRPLPQPNSFRTEQLDALDRFHRFQYVALLGCMEDFIGAEMVAQWPHCE